MENLHDQNDAGNMSENGLNVHTEIIGNQAGGNHVVYEEVPVGQQEMPMNPNGDEEPNSRSRGRWYNNWNQFTTCCKNFGACIWCFKVRSVTKKSCFHFLAVLGVTFIALSLFSSAYDLKEGLEPKTCWQKVPEKEKNHTISQFNQGNYSMTLKQCEEKKSQQVLKKQVSSAVLNIALCVIAFIVYWFCRCFQNEAVPVNSVPVNPVPVPLDPVPVPLDPVPVPLDPVPVPVNPVPVPLDSDLYAYVPENEYLSG